MDKIREWLDSLDKRCNRCGPQGGRTIKHKRRVKVLPVVHLTAEDLAFVHQSADMIREGIDLMDGLTEGQWADREAAELAGLDPDG